MVNNKQQLLIEYLISSPDTFALCKSIVKSEYFDPEYRKTINFLHTYYDKYNATPSPEQINAETNISVKKQIITRDQISYCADEIEQFCKRKAIEGAILSAPKFINDGDYGKVETMIRDAITVSLNRDLGISYFDDPLKRLEAMSMTSQRTPTGFKPVDNLIDGGLARTEIILFSANSGGGKSITLANLAVNFLAQKLNVLYLTLELSEELVSKRFDTMFTGIPTVVSQTKYQEIAIALDNVSPHYGKMTIKHMPSGTNANAIRAYLKEFELKNGYVPDLLIVDYLDIMGTNEHVSVDNVSGKDKLATEQLRDVGFDYNMFIATASQQNRAAREAQELHQGHIAGGITKVNTVDIYISITMTPAMKIAGEMMMTFLKSRNSDAEGKIVYMVWDNNSLRIRNPKSNNEEIDDNGVIQRKVLENKNINKSSKRSVLDIMDI